MNITFLLLPALLLLSCQPRPDNPAEYRGGALVNIESIPVPAGFTRIDYASHSYSHWLRQIHIRKDNRVLLYNGRPSNDQSSHFAVLDLPIGNKDLQQCADAAMRLRADYFLSRNLPDSIRFKSTSGQLLSFTHWRSGTRYQLSGNKLVAYSTSPSSLDPRSDLLNFLEFAFQFCGTLSLQRDLHPLADLQQMVPGDVFVKGGSPGHAMTIVDMATNDKGQKIFLLSQGFMPAQDIHIVRNPSDPAGDPWYSIDDIEYELVTPGWTFTKQQLYRW